MVCGPCSSSYSEKHQSVFPSKKEKHEAQVGVTILSAALLGGWLGVQFGAISRVQGMLVGGLLGGGFIYADYKEPEDRPQFRTFAQALIVAAGAATVYSNPISGLPGNLSALAGAALGVGVIYLIF